VAWWIDITPQVVRGVVSFGFKDLPPDRILESVEGYLANHGDPSVMDRWNRCPDDFFVYSHVFIDGGRWQRLEFIVEDTSALVGVLRVVWVEHYSGDLT
jgi:hypothetical protein